MLAASTTTMRHDPLGDGRPIIRSIVESRVEIGHSRPVAVGHGAVERRLDAPEGEPDEGGAGASGGGIYGHHGPVVSSPEVKVVASSEMVRLWSTVTASSLKIECSVAVTVLLLRSAL